jgi:hypothetical protein
MTVFNKDPQREECHKRKKKSPKKKPVLPRYNNVIDDNISYICRKHSPSEIAPCPINKHSRKNPGKYFPQMLFPRKLTLKTIYSQKRKH